MESPIYTLINKSAVTAAASAAQYITEEVVAMGACGVWGTTHVLRVPPNKMQQ